MQHEDVTAVVWRDKSVVLLLSTNFDPRTDGSVTRKTGKGNEETEIACPQAVINYTKHMGGVDVNDQKREYYGVGRSSKKWWKFILHFVLNVCLVNCFILYDLTKSFIIHTLIHSIALLLPYQPLIPCISLYLV